MEGEKLEQKQVALPVQEEGNHGVPWLGGPFSLGQVLGDSSPGGLGVGGAGDLQGLMLL